MNKTIFITGASTGLGKAAAQLFAAKGWNVIATMRQPEKATDLADLPQVTLLALDVTNPVQIRQVAEQATAMGPIDVVFNNAGYGLMGPLEGLSGEQIVRQVETNMLGVIFTTQAFIPHFRAKGSGLFISTTSIGGLVAFPFSSIYHATKWGIEGWSESMAFELKPFGIGIKTVSPGYILTDFAGRSLDLGRSEAYDGLLDKMMGIFSDAENSGSYSTAEQVADVVYEAATDGRDKLRYVAGKDAQALYTQRLELGDEAFRKGMAEQLFG